jgi:putative transposase
MPDHFHAIVKIVHTESGNNTVGTGCDIVGTGRDLSLQCNNPVQNNNNLSPRKYKPLDQIIGAFKTTSSKLIHQSGYNDYAWQRSYYDHIVRDTVSLNRIRQYIIDNLINWNPYALVYKKIELSELNIRLDCFNKKSAYYINSVIQ